MLNYVDYIDFQYYAITVRLTKTAWYTILFSKLFWTIWCLQNCSTTNIKKYRKTLLIKINYVIKFHPITLKFTSNLRISIYYAFVKFEMFILIPSWDNRSEPKFNQMTVVTLNSDLWPWKWHCHFPKFSATSEKNFRSVPCSNAEKIDENQNRIQKIENP